MAAQNYGDSDRLTPEQRRKLKRRTTDSSRARLRKRFRENDSPRNSGRNSGGNEPNPSRPGPLVQRANQLTNLEYAPLENSLNDRGAAIGPGGWFDQYRQQVGQAQQMSQQYAAPILQQAQGRADQAGQMAPGVDPNAPAGQDAALAAAARASLGNAFVTLLQGFGQTQNDYFAGRQSVASTAQLAEQGTLQRDRERVSREKGLSRKTTLEGLRDKAHTQRLENAAFGLDQYEAQVDAADTVADNRRAAREDRRERRRESGEPNKYGYTDKEWRSMSTPERQKAILRFDKSDGKPGDGKGFTPLQRSETKIQIRKGIEKVVGKLRGRKTAPSDYWKQAYDALVGELDYDPVVARAVIQIVRDGRAKPGTMKTIRRDYGVAKLPVRKPFQLPDPYVIPDRPPVGDPPGEYGPT